MSNDNTTSEHLEHKAPLNKVQWEQIAVAYGQLQEIREKSIPSKEDETTAEGLIEFLAQNFLEFAPDFLGAWITVQSEYVPLLNTLIPVLTRAEHIDRARKQASAIANKKAADSLAGQAETTPSNIVSADFGNVTQNAVLKSRLASPAGQQLVQLSPAQQDQIRRKLEETGKV